MKVFARDVMNLTVRQGFVSRAFFISSLFSGLSEKERKKLVKLENCTWKTQKGMKEEKVFLKKEICS